jgi:hypothetical protein
VSSEAQDALESSSKDLFILFGATDYTFAIQNVGKVTYIFI